MCVRVCGGLRYLYDNQLTTLPFYLCLPLSLTTFIAVWLCLFLYLNLVARRADLWGQIIFLLVDGAVPQNQLLWPSIAYLYSIAVSPRFAHHRSRVEQRPVE